MQASKGKIPSVITPAYLTTLRGHPQLPAHTWYYIAGVTLSSLNRPDEIPKVLTFALENGIGPHDTATPSHEESLRTARRLREGLVKSAAITGLPKTINALLALRAVTPEELLDPPLSPSPSLRAAEISSVPSQQILHRGQAYFDQIYGKVSKRVMGQMDCCGTEDLGITARLLYGYILSAGDSILSPKDTSFVLLAGLVPQDVNPQLKGHLKGALNNGASLEEVRAVMELVIGICKRAGMTKLPENSLAAWGWRGEIANL